MLKLSRAERWILSNQYRILEALYPGQARFAAARQAIERGYEIHYDMHCVDVVDDNHVMSGADSLEVQDILQMFTDLKRCHIPANAPSTVEDRHIRFAGFDGNDETRQVAYALYICRLDGESYPDIDPSKIRGDCPTLARYQRQLTEWKKSADRARLTESDVVRIAAAAQPAK